MPGKRKSKTKWWEKKWKREDNKCEICGKKIKAGSLCYWCGKRRGLW